MIFNRNNVVNDVIVIVSTFNRKRYLRLLLQSLLNQTVKPGAILVVDGPSTDGTDKMVREEFPEIMYIRLNHDVGGSGQFYLGLKIAYKLGYNWFWVMDDDVIFDSKALESMLNAILKWSRFKHIGIVVPSVKMNNKFIKYRYAIFAGSMISRDLITRIGFPRPDFFLLFDDTEYLYRTFRSGFVVIYLDDPLIRYHRGDAMLLNLIVNKKFIIIIWKYIIDLSMSPKRLYYFIRNGIIFTRKYKELRWLIGILKNSLLSLIYYVAYLRNLLVIFYVLRGIFDGLLNLTGKRV